MMWADVRKHGNLLPMLTHFSFACCKPIMGDPPPACFTLYLSSRGIGTIVLRVQYPLPRVLLNGGPISLSDTRKHQTIVALCYSTCLHAKCSRQAQSHLSLLFLDCFYRPAIFWPPLNNKTSWFADSQFVRCGLNSIHQLQGICLIIVKKHQKIHRLSRDPRMRLPRSLSGVSRSHNDADITR